MQIRGPQVSEATLNWFSTFITCNLDVINLCASVYLVLPPEDVIIGFFHSRTSLVLTIGSKYICNAGSF